MALIDLSLVTSGLMKLLEDNINKVIDTGANVTVTAEPPDKVGSVTNKLSLYMYHVTEEAFYKNFEGPGGDFGRNIARTPMGLCLYYVLTAHHESSEPEFDPLTQQRLMGYALKTMHDYPLIVDSTEILDELILPADLRGADNPVQVIMRPTAPEDAIAFWGAEDQRTARLSAYYEVRVILLEPDPPTSLVAPVLSLGAYLYQLGTPHLESTHSELAFVMPAAAGGGAQLVKASPARASADTGATPIDNQVIFTGHNLLGGIRRQLWLVSEHFSDVGGQLPIDLELADNPNAGWSLTASSDQLVLEIGAELYYDDDGSPTPINLLPGIYGAFLRVTVQERMAGGVLVPMTNDSNRVSFAVIPRIDSVVEVDDVDRQITLRLVNTFDLTDSSLTVQLFCDGQSYTKDTLPGAGRFQIDDLETLTFHVHPEFDFATPGDHAVRLIVNGAESAPYWIEIA
ncbi:MAG TPA: DUF4255 domain-containing protein [Enhygromyxa sp.]|nr:DUF4255 domain-containing protein [Enhygromyxa sp.]